MRQPQALAQVLACDRAGGDAHGGLARGGAPAAAMIAHAVLLLIGVVRVARAKMIAQGIVVALARVLVLDDEPDGRAGGPALEYARQDAHCVRLAALAHVPRPSGPRGARGRAECLPP